MNAAAARAATNAFDLELNDAALAAAGLDEQYAVLPDQANGGGWRTVSEGDGSAFDAAAFEGPVRL